MSSRRNLKKNINNVMEMLYIDCIFYKAFVVDADIEAANKVIAKIGEAHESLIKRVSATEGREAKGRVKAYFKKLNADFREQANTLAKDISSLG
ncbi:hypothetical protein [Dysgonomonas sp. 511]|uniref:hypothetical protein n=1 Tax=Dysgonomonas sp. 511 TaxID=2302930 RepID=UPI0013D3B148|nr:hypothetical protein [Dysgonomonas sp. 511]NDV78189.1 hypothetical protein [Dysgonomonas sp. 511]